MKNLYFASIFATIGLLAACNKDKVEPTDDDHDHETVTGTISITSPAEGDTVKGATFLVTGSVVASAEVHGYHVKVTKQSDSSVVYENESHTHASTLAINETVTHSLTTVTPLTIFVESALDHQGHTINKTVKVIYKP